MSSETLFRITMFCLFVCWSLLMIVIGIMICASGWVTWS